MKNKNLHVKSSSSTFRRWLLLALASFIGLGVSVQAHTLYVSQSTTDSVYSYNWTDGNIQEAWPGTYLGDGSYEMYVHDTGTHGNYIINDNDGNQTGDLSLSQDTWGVYNGLTTFTVVMVYSELFDTDQVEFQSAGFTNDYATFDGTDFTLANVSYTSGNGMDVYVGGTKFEAYSSTEMGSKATGTYDITWDQTTGDVTFVPSNVEDQVTTVFLAETAVVSNDVDVDLSGYLKYTGCAAGGITDYGFYLSKTSNLDENTSGVIKVAATGTPSAISAGTVFEATKTDLDMGTTYYYRAYADSAGTMILTDEELSFKTLGDDPKIVALDDKITVCGEFTDFASLYVNGFGGDVINAEVVDTTETVLQWQKSTDSGSTWVAYNDGHGVNNDNIRPNEAGMYRMHITVTDIIASSVVAENYSNEITITESGSCSETTVCSTLPVFIINTIGTEFPTCADFTDPSCDGKVKIGVDVKVLWNQLGGEVTEADAFGNSANLYYDRKARMNYRGSSSMNFDKKQYTFNTGDDDCEKDEPGVVNTKKVTMFGMSKSKNWVLYAAYSDGSLMRNALSYSLYAKMTNKWAPKTKYVDVYLDGEYRGVYVFMEKIERNDDRINIPNTGMILKWDKTDREDRYYNRTTVTGATEEDYKKNTFRSKYTGRKDLSSYSATIDQMYEIEYPEREDISSFDEFGALVTGGDDAWDSIVTAKIAHLNEIDDALKAGDNATIRENIDYESFADLFIMSELSKNPDAYRVSCVFVSENSITDPLKAYPIWDYELGWNNGSLDLGKDQRVSTGWLCENAAMRSDGFSIPFWWTGEGGSSVGTESVNTGSGYLGLMDDPCFLAMIKQRWAEHTAIGGALHPDSITANITALSDELTTSGTCSNSPVDRDGTKWPYTARGVAGYSAQPAWSTQKSDITSWVTARMANMDTYIDAFSVTTSLSGMSDTDVNEGDDLSLTSTPTPTGTYDYQWYFYPTASTMTPAALAALATNEWTSVGDGTRNLVKENMEADDRGYYFASAEICTGRVYSDTVFVDLVTSCIGDEVVTDEISFSASATSLPSGLTSTTSYQANLNYNVSGGFSINKTSTFTTNDDASFYKHTDPNDGYVLGVRAGDAASGTILTYSPTTEIGKTYKIVVKYASLCKRADVDGDVELKTYDGSTQEGSTDSFTLTGDLSDNISWITYTSDSFEATSTTASFKVDIDNAYFTGMAFESFKLIEVAECSDVYYYRVKLDNLDTSDYIYTDTIEGTSAGTADITLENLRCNANYTYQVQYKKQDDLWTNATGTGASGTMGGSVLGGDAQMYFTGLDDEDPSSAAISTITPINRTVDDYYWHCVYSDVNGTQVMTAQGTNAAPDFVVSSGYAMEEIPAGASYSVYKDYSSTFDPQLSCIVSDQVVPAEFTGSLAFGEVVTVSYTGGNSTATFVRGTHSDFLWVATPNFTGINPVVKTTTAGATYNILQEVDAAGNQKQFKGDYYLYKFVNPVAYTTGNTMSSTVYAGDDTSNPVATGVAGDFGDISSSNTMLRWLYNSTLDTAYVFEITSDVYLETKDANGIETKHAMTVNTTTGECTVNLDFYTDDVSGGYRITAQGPSAVWTYPWSAEYIIPSILESDDVQFDYNFGQNTMEVTYSQTIDLEIDCATGLESGGLQVLSNGKIQVTIKNVGSVDVPANSYHLDVISTLDVVPMTGSYVALAQGATATFTSLLSVLPDTTSYQLVASVSMDDDTHTDNNTCAKELCTPPTGDTIVFTINMDLLADNDCFLQYRSVETAVSKLKANTAYFNSTTTELLKHIIFDVYPTGDTYVGTSEAGYSGGDVLTAPTIKIENINNVTTPLKRFTIRTQEGTQSQAALQHLILRNSKNITLDNIQVLGNPSDAIVDNAIDIDNGTPTGSWVSEPVGDLANANIQVKNCTLESNGFTCVHMAAIDGVCFENNDIIANLTDDLLLNTNTSDWGASVKAIRSTNINFNRNFIRGDHATLMWLQSCENALVMNNVTWSNNDVNHTTVGLRLVSQTGLDVDSIGAYYNTMFVDDGDNSYSHDFVYFGGPINGSNTAFDVASLDFQYNNCYAFSPTINGNSSSPFQGITESTLTGYNHNNFWSVYDDDNSNTSSVYAIGQDPYFIEVPVALCQTAASDPKSLIVKGIGLNVGDIITEDISGFSADTLYNDRLNADDIRPAGGTLWTLGAYQQTEGVLIDTIIWQGGADGYSGSENDWDNRNNWLKTSGDVLTCVDYLSEDLRTIIPAPNSTLYTGLSEVVYYPEIPSDFSSTTIRPIKDYLEQVDAGVGVDGVTPAKFLDTIQVDFGGAVLGAHNLVQGTDTLYNVAESEFVAQRNEWILVGTVVMPFTGVGKETRNLKSGDFYIEDQEPHVYMRQAQTTVGGTVSWNAAFADTTAEVTAEKVFAIQIPDQYGRYKMTSNFYYSYQFPDLDKVNDNVEPKEFAYQGLFYNQASLPVYADLVQGESTLLCNTYPANIDANALEDEGTGTIQIYSYVEDGGVVSGSFGPVMPGDLIKPQQGFIVSPTASGAGSYNIPNNVIVGSSTKYRSTRSGEQEKPYFYMSAKKAFFNTGSKIGFRYDQFKGEDVENPATDTPKAFNVTTTMTDVPELYAMKYDKKYSRVDLPEMDQVIPLGLQLRENMDVRFQMVDRMNYTKAVLEDRATGKSYNLISGGSYTVPQVQAGTIEGRFFLNLEDADDVNSGNGTPTDDLEDEVKDNSISTFVNNKRLYVSSSSEVTLQEIQLVSMTGRVIVLKPTTDHYGEYNLQLTPGVYIVKVLSDVMTKETKFLIK